ncbi:MAG: hypothetical protein MUE30_01045 [Spirosomaceae bacterium]|nr:hypothetical protein [Spirosomataceae bacterium]
MILRSGDNYVQIDVLERLYQNDNDYWDGNWLNSEVKINFFGFKGIYGTNFRSDEFQQFYNHLIKLKNNLTQKVEFAAMEEGLYLEGKIDVTGNIKWKGIAKPEFGSIQFIFDLETDSASIDNVIHQLKEILEKYPVIGNIS